MVPLERDTLSSHIHRECGTVVTRGSGSKGWAVIV